MYETHGLDEFLVMVRGPVHTYSSLLLVLGIYMCLLFLGADAYSHDSRMLYSKTLASFHK